MTPEELFAAAFNEWKSSETEEEGALKLEGVIQSAMHENGVVLEIPESVVNKTGGCIPISGDAADRFSTKGEGNIRSFEVIPGGMFELRFDSDFKHKSRLLIKTPQGVFGTFYSEHVTNLKRK